MKTLLIFLFLIPFTLMAQSDNSGTLKVRKQHNNGEAFKQLVQPGEFDDPLFTIVEEMPEFPGGQNAMMTYLGNNLTYPIDAKNADIGGTVYVQFVIDKQGSVGKVNVLRGVHPSLDQEAIRVIQNMPDWNAGKQRGKQVDVIYTIPINFVLK